MLFDTGIEIAVVLLTSMVCAQGIFAVKTRFRMRHSLQVLSMKTNKMIGTSMNANVNFSEVVNSLIKDKKIDNKLHTLSSLSEVRSWDYSLPTLTKSGVDGGARFLDRHRWNSSELIKSFEERYP